MKRTLTIAVRCQAPARSTLDRTISLDSGRETSQPVKPFSVWLDTLLVFVR